MGGWEAEARSGPGKQPNPQGRGLPLEPLLSNWLSSGSVGETITGSNSMASEEQIPFPIRLTLNQLLELAEETELRAVTLRWMGSSRTPSSQKAQSLLQIAAELRHTAERLLSEVWLDSSQSSLR
jgi:hypothetical protein